MDDTIVHPCHAPAKDEAPHLLVVDDDARIVSLLSRYLSDNGFRITCAQNAATARRCLEGLHFDLMILDVMMPGESGIALAADVRKTSNLAILMLTARSEAEHRITGLEAGVDDYLAKPFEPRELLLRIHNILRRSSPQEISFSELACFGPYQFHFKRGELKHGSKVIPLTDREKEILRTLVKHEGNIVSRSELLFQDIDVHERTIDVQINRLRRKIEHNPGHPVYLQTVRGQGYRLILN